mmetsp:Transcript_37380/g.101175  ORF Transcript_37380/g.101175 Transcript_37380/m.101175 type:complete len:276 (+) Transcript_37380:133-960(+)
MHANEQAEHDRGRLQDCCTPTSQPATLSSTEAAHSTTPRNLGRGAALPVAAALLALPASARFRAAAALPAAAAAPLLIASAGPPTAPCRPRARPGTGVVALTRGRWAAAGCRPLSTPCREIHAPAAGAPASLAAAARWLGRRAPAATPRSEDDLAAFLPGRLLRVQRVVRLPLPRVASPVSFRPRGAVLALGSRSRAGASRASAGGLGGSPLRRTTRQLHRSRRSCGGCAQAWCGGGGAGRSRGAWCEAVAERLLRGRIRRAAGGALAASEASAT